MKFTELAISLAFAGVVSSAAIQGLGLPIVEGTVAGVDGAVDGTLSAAGLKRDSGDALSGAVYGVTSSLNGVTGIAGSLAGTAESTTSGLVGTAESTVGGLIPAKRDELGAITGTVEGTVDTTVGATTDAVEAVVPPTVHGISVYRNPSGLIGALEGLHVALARGDITHGQLSGIPVELENVVAYLYTA
ncbi:hypothetical protein N7468_004198 [Penicillium chermesinum]|uniref:Uncharacterized protein n=1 Tax=Penicillium chermesinum TaxID=63820 RepID=A0A9W9P842_9EURO|nr:uncharacterized protein N7468_004198 [Penicillium chermesinum]KAJ5239579.1 hypothetical protein N7468_004198 [Penicillium chermesinum]